MYSAVLLTPAVGTTGTRQRDTQQFSHAPKRLGMVPISYSSSMYDIPIVGGNDGFHPVVYAVTY